MKKYNIGDIITAKNTEFVVISYANKYESKFSVNSYGLKCLKCGTEIDRTTSCIKQSCVHCNSLKVQRPDLLKYLVNENDAELRYKSNKKIKIKCPDCNNIFEKRVSHFTRDGFKCPNCSDFISYPNKFSYEFLNQLGVKNIEHEYSPDWIKPKRYDNYFEHNGKKFILEMDGQLGHGNRTFEGYDDIQGIKCDEYKDKMAKKHNIIVIRIDAKESNVDYLKENFLKNNILNQYFDLNNIDWIKCGLFAEKNFAIETCNLYNDGLSTKDISLIMGVHSCTIIEWLKRGTEIGLCNYNSKTVIENSKKRVVQFDKNLNLIDTYESLSEAHRITGIRLSEICSCCKKKRNSAGGFLWRYEEDSENIKYIKKGENQKKQVVQLDLKGNIINIWKSAKDVENELGIGHSAIAACCKRRYHTAGGYIWRYADEVDNIKLA